MKVQSIAKDILKKSNEDAQQIANTIKQQIGHKALYMIGAKNLAFGTDSKTGNVYLSFKIMRNEKKVSYIRVEYNYGSDDYSMVFLNQSGKEIKRVDGLYFDDLNNAIENNTGLYTKL